MLSGMPAKLWDKIVLYAELANSQLAITAFPLGWCIVPFFKHEQIFGQGMAANGPKAPFPKRPVVSASASLRIERLGMTAMTVARSKGTSIQEIDSFLKVCMRIFHEVSVVDDIARAEGNTFSLKKQVASPLICRLE